MLRNLKDLFDNLAASLTAPAGAQLPAEQAHTLQLSTAVLLVEVMRAEPDLKDSERDGLTALEVPADFGAGDPAAAELLRGEMVLFELATAERAARRMALTLQGDRLLEEGKALEARRLERDFGVDLQAAALILDLQREVRRLKAALQVHSR